MSGVFQLGEGRLTSEDFQLVGPTTRVVGSGTVDIATGKARAHTYFHFLDAQRVKMPVMRHLLKVLHPVSSGFEAKLSGSIGDPKWSVWFNPLRFLAPEKRR
jgi:hypothetical protein